MCPSYSNLSIGVSSNSLLCAALNAYAAVLFSIFLIIYSVRSRYLLEVSLTPLSLI